MAKVRTDVGLGERHWVTEDGHLHVSVPTEVPVMWWHRREATHLSYVSGDYRIKRCRHGKTGWIYRVLREEVELPLAFYSRLADAKERAVKNAKGLDRMNVA